MAALNGKKIFGAGRFFGINNVTAPTPARFSVPQDMSIDFKRSVKALFGEGQSAADVSGGEMSVTGKVTLGTNNARIFNDLMFGGSTSTSLTTEADSEAGTASASVVTVSHAATWTVDLGVVNTATGIRYARVTSAPVAGVSYTVAAGVYTFAAGDATVAVKISYLYTTAASGETVTMTNQTQGKVNDFTAVYVWPWTNNSNVVEQDVLTLNSCIASDFGIASKVGDYAKPTFSFEAACDTTDTLGTFSFAEAA